MNPNQFLAGLGLTTLMQVVLNLILIWTFPIIRHHFGFILVCMVAMILFCGTVYLAASVLAKSRLTRLYIQLVMIAVFLKMLVCLALVIGYKKIYDPADHSFLWPFLVIYVTYTIFEVIFLEKVGRQKKTTLS
jgi:hypothetical protein